MDNDNPARLDQGHFDKTIQEETVSHGVDKAQHTNPSDTSASDASLPPKMTLAQYTMMIPMAVVYLAGRTVLDVTRGCLYHALYNAELAVPVVDEWLFNKVTVWLPKKYDEAEVWWTTRGRQRYYDLQHTLIYRTIPATIDHIDAFFLTMYNGGVIVADTAHKVADAWWRFREKHDWRQLALDMGNAGYTLIGRPLILASTHIYRLGTIFCQGCWYGLKATWDDLRWVATVGVPGIVDWIGSTRGWLWMNQGWDWCQGWAKTMGLKVAVMLSPVLRWVGLWLVRLGDSVASWIQSDTMQRIRRYLLGNLTNGAVWLCGELVALMQSLKTMATAMVDHGLIPVVNLFSNHVLPRLSLGYQRFLAQVTTLYEAYVRPFGLLVVAWLAKSLWPLSRLLERYYQGVLSFLSRWNWDGVVLVSGAMVRCSHWVITWLTMTAGPMINSMATALIYHYLPLTVESLQQGWHKVMGDLDYSKLVSVVEHVAQVIQEQASLIFASLERTMNDWKEAQLEPDLRADKGNVDKAS
ncbi:hypothetical protein [Absidia glauca]|uniref:Uncharacterized protein n=1 Tax=Absidia glauca TaxID=4829 RepID=A0A163JBT7_ABSGL|nr:hypothetical protein [Absidia glauca]